VVIFLPCFLKLTTGGTMKAEVELSDLKCRKAVTKAKPYRLADKGGLALLVMPEGGKLWRWRYRFGGKMKQMALGIYPGVTLAQARILHANARGELARGTDPMAVRKEDKQLKKAKKAEKTVAEAGPVDLTFETLAWKWFAWWKSDKKAGYVKDVKSRLEGDIVAKVGNRAPEGITRLEWVMVIKAIDERGAGDLARRALQNVNQIYEYGIDNGLLDQNLASPAAGIRPEKIITRGVARHCASLSIGEVPDLLRRMRNYTGRANTRMAMELMSLTFLRTSELIGGLWSEIDWEEKLWRVPGPRMKMKKPHLVPLAPQALDLLRQVHAANGATDRLFPIAKKSGPGVMSTNTILGALDQMGYRGKMTGHGWRSVASTYLHEKGFDHEVIEMQLAHSGEDKVSGAYNNAKYLPQRTEMMQAWADALDQLREKSR